MHGVKIPENLADEMPDDQDLPYLEMLYKFVFGKKSYYHLASTRHVEPQANIERMSEEEVTTDRHDMREMERGAKTKKAHWRIPPATRVRVRQRIRRWGGYLYNIDLFPYIEHRLLAFIKA